MLVPLLVPFRLVGAVYGIDWATITLDEGSEISDQPSAFSA